MRAIWRGETIAESDQTIVVEGNHYFPPQSLKAGSIKPSAKNTVCGWKGTANYYDVIVGDEVNRDAAWYYPHPKEAAGKIEGYVAFWRGVEVKP